MRRAPIVKPMRTSAGHQVNKTCARTRTHTHAHMLASTAGAPAKVQKGKYIIIVRRGKVQLVRGIDVNARFVE